MIIPTFKHLIDHLNGRLEDESDTAAAPYLQQAVDRLSDPQQPGIGGPTAVPSLSVESMAALVDHTQLKPEATANDIRQLCAEAREYGFASACVNPSFVPLTVKELDGADIAVCTVAGFPLGATQTSAKVHEATQALADGAREIDMVLSIGRLKSGHYQQVEGDIRAVVDAVRDASADGSAGESGEMPALVKVILETALLTDPEKALACVIAQRAGADYVKTSTGFSTGGATTEDVALMRQMVGDDLGVKASGGVGSPDDVRQMVAHGATRIGASGSVGIMQDRLEEA